jgi:steroid delta-isomerase-like uncharacterized protein
MSAVASQPEDKSRVAEGVVEAYNNGDWERFRASHAADVVYEEIGTGQRTEGMDEYMQLLEGWKQAIPDGAATIRRTVESGDTVVMELVWKGTQSGDLQTPGGTVPASGRQIEVEATMWSDFEGDKVRQTRHYLDIMTLLQQLGATSEPS